MNDVTAFGGRECQGFCDNSSLITKKRDIGHWGEGVSKIIKTCVTSFMDDPLIDIYDIDFSFQRIIENGNLE
jgi:hypothetical protein